jgi:HD superfamily phosphohydrolase
VDLQRQASYRDPIHGFIHADPLEHALINSRPVQRLRWIHQLGFAYLVFPGAEHSRFSHVLGAMKLAGRVYDALAAKAPDLLIPDQSARDRRLVRVAALVHDVGHAPFSHSAEDLFDGGIDHEEMTRRILLLDEVRSIFDRFGDGITPEDVCSLLGKPKDPRQRLLAQVISGELDVDKMDYLLRDSLYCGVRYGSYDLDRILETIEPIRDPETGEWGIGVEEGGVHAIEALVMARYYMFTQVYFNMTGKALELHFNEWLLEQGRRWPSAPLEFLEHDDISAMSWMRNSDSPHARAVVERLYYRLAFETAEHLSRAEREAFKEVLGAMKARFGSHALMVSNSAKDPHRLGQARVHVRQADGSLKPMEESSQFIRHLARIERFRVYTAPSLRDQVAAAFKSAWPG